MTSNGVDPDEMTAQERLGEAARILAIGILRFRMKQEVNIRPSHPQFKEISGTHPN